MDLDDLYTCCDDCEFGTTDVLESEHNHDSSTSNKALQIPVILQQVLKYLPHNDQKKSRLVCRTWDEEACRILRKNSKTVLNSSKRLISFYLEKFENGTPWFGCFQLINVHVSTPSMEHFFKTFGNKIKSLDLRDSKWTTADLEHILTDIMPNLEELALHGLIPKDARIFQNSSPTNIRRLPKIKKIDFQLHEKSTEESPLQNFLNDLLSVMPNVERISSRETKKADMKGKNRREKFHRILFESLINPEDNQIDLRHLSQVDYSLTPWGEDQVQQLIAKQFPLNYLSIDILSSVSTQSFLLLLTSLKKTLVKLKLSFTSWRTTEFPCNLGLDNLQHLSLDWFNGSLKFVPHLPQLKTLILAQIDLNAAFLEDKNIVFRKSHPLSVLEVYQHSGASILPVTIRTIASVFPKLKKIVLGRLTDESIREIFTLMPLLEDFSAIEGQFTDTGITGIPLMACKICGKKHLAELCKGVYNLALVNAQKQYCSISVLQNLRRLELRSPHITNLSVFHGVVMVKSLRSLSLWSCELTFRSLRKLVDELNLNYLETTHSFVHRVEVRYAVRRMSGRRFILNGLEAPTHSIIGSPELESFLGRFIPLLYSNQNLNNWKLSCPGQQVLQNLVL